MTKLSYAIVMVSEMDRSVAFYRDVLGFPLKFASGEWTEFATGDVTIALHPGSVATEDGPASVKPLAGQCRLGFGVNDLDAFHARMLAKGVTCLRPPADEHGTRLASYADPDGLPFSVAQTPQKRN